MKSKEESWDDAFSATSFSLQQIELMRSMNIWYECLNARHDFHAQMKKDMAQIPSTDGIIDQFFSSLNDMVIEESFDGLNKPLNFNKDAISAAVSRCEKKRCGLMNDT